ncbi:amidohydrolase family protein [Parerythrobacter jejuensis]|uniref:Amidohydrolase family protein n=1 Tax=Parerythrobacter jejuensis TaxID=795812 RepID=A0A845B543_9SPHN|nr:amidohydrolase family protein [Parerythrobacter jejuensis]MXP31328.1 amidohydrolase family protein [Parerythrobacter jejuensis]MXP34088.1 amidohydrolase family protein [Parerythrobacter jejuensis]
MKSLRALLLSSALVLTPAAALAQDGDDGGKDEKWDVNAPKGATIKQVPIQTDEGTWMDVDVSPDGRRVAFSMLGDIYTMPISGGTPTRIAEGLAWEVQPRFSPDGSRIAFTSDRAGGDNIWLMDADGSDKTQLTKESFRLLNQPTWSPDGEFIAAKKHFTTGRSLGTGEVWLYHVTGGSGVKLVKRPNETHQKELGEPIYAPDGEAIYFTRNDTSGPIFEYAQDSNAGIFRIEKYDLTTGERTTAVDGFGGAVRPTPSPDGSALAFVRRDKADSQLWVKDLASGSESMLYGDLDLDVQETWAVTGVYPNMDWTPDSRSIVFWAGGKLRRINKDGSGSAVIPFTIDDTRGVADAPHPVIDVAPASFTTSIPKFATLSPDGRRVVFETLGKLYVKGTGGGSARRLTSSPGTTQELWPAFSRDGRSMAFVRWTDDDLGEIVVGDANGGNLRTITSQPGHYAVPQFSPDGRTIVFEKRSGGFLTAPEYSDNAGVYSIPASGGTPTMIARGMASPQFGADGDRLFMSDFAGGKLQLVSTDLNGEAKRVHAQGDLANEFSVSPNGKLIAFRQNYEVFAMPLMPGGQAVNVSEKGGPLPVTKVSTGGADYIGWSGNGGTLAWSMGPEMFRVSTADLFGNAPGSDTSFSSPESGISLAMTQRAAKPSGTVAITGARILTMTGEGAGAIDNGTIVIEGDRIVAVGADVAVPAGATMIDASGKTIMPGLVDAHAHGPQGVGDLIPEQNWVLVQQLAMGTTTMHDPSSRASMIFAASERQRAGMLLAPRIFSTGEIIYGAKAPSVYARIDSYDDALAHVRRIKKQGGISVKNYNQPRREQRQMVARAAAAEDMLVVAEGGSLFGMDMNLVADGNSTVEHNVPGEVFYEDVLQFFSQSGSNYTPTLTVTYGGLAGDPYWRQATDVFDNPLLVHTPPKRLLAATARRTKAPDWAFVDDDASREAKKLADRGVKVSIGAHGQQAGIAAHWELWSFVRGGMSAVEALRAGTIAPAQSLGMDKDIGSLEVGKLADLIVLDADPSVDIRNSDKIDSVMLGGRMYDATTMNEVATGTSKRKAYFWEN